MDNLFNFEYLQKQLKNLDGTKSRFSTVFGENGNIINCPKDSYKIIPTQDVSILGKAFMDKGMQVSPFTHKSGEVIGLNIPLLTNKMTAIGDKNYNAIITIPNNGGGKGYLAIKELRLICTNGQVRSKIMHKDSYIKVPHSLDYKYALNMIEESLNQFDAIMHHMEEFDEALNGKTIDKYQALRILNEWYYMNEMPDSHKKDMSITKFRELLFTTPAEIKSINRYNQLIESFKKETEYNKELGLEMSYYTCFASVTNYLSRRQEASGSAAPKEIQEQRTSKKLEYFESLAV